MLQLFILTLLVLGIVVVGQQNIQTQNVASNYNQQDLYSLFTTEPTARRQQVTPNLNEQNEDLLINSLFTTEPTIKRSVSPPPINVPENRNVGEQEINILITVLFSTEPTITDVKPITTVSPPVQRRPNTTKLPTMKPPTTGVELPPGVPIENRCLNGECVVYYQCGNNSIIKGGEGLIDIRFSEDKPLDCHHYLEICCGNENAINEQTILLPTSQPKPTGCGFRNTEGIGYRITGKDSEAQYGEFPWMVAIMKEERAGDKVLAIYQCGGSLIHPQVVLTAAHCVQGRQANTLKIRAGEWDTQTKNEIYPDQNRDVVDIDVHPQYYRAALYNDVALLYLDSPVELAENVQMVCLPPQNAVFDYSRCTASGWGKDVFGRQGKYQVILKKIELPIVPRSSCLSSLRRTRLGQRFILHNSFICAGGEPGKDTCNGDGGSPLVCPIENEQDRYYQSGIVAWGIGCGEDQLPAVYVNVALFRNWIDQIFAQRGLDSSYYTA